MDFHALISRQTERVVNVFSDFEYSSWEISIFELLRNANKIFLSIFLLSFSILPKDISPYGRVFIDKYKIENNSTEILINQVQESVGLSLLPAILINMKLWYYLSRFFNINLS